MAERSDSERKWIGIPAAAVAVVISCAAIVGYLAHARSDERADRKPAEAHEELAEAPIDGDPEDSIAEEPADEDELPAEHVSPLEDVVAKAPKPGEPWIPDESNGAADPTKPRLTLLEAKYGSGEVWIDVLDRLKGLVRDDCLAVDPSQVVESDPLPGRPKTLFVRWAMDGEIRRTIAYEGEMLCIDARRPVRLDGEVLLLDKIDPNRDAIRGSWKFKGRRLQMPAAREACLEVPQAVPEFYELTAIVTCDEQTDGLVIGLPVGRSMVAVVIDDGLKNTALTLVDGQASAGNSAVKAGRLLHEGGRNTIVCRVRRELVEVSCNGRQVLYWTGDSQRLSLPTTWAVRDPRHVFIGTQGTAWDIIRLELLPLPKTNTVWEPWKSDCGLPEALDDGNSRARALACRIRLRRDAAVKSGEATAASEAAVESGLDWLARHQDTDGSWSFKTGNAASNAADARMGATGLALLAFLGAGHSHKTGDYARTVGRGLNYLTNNMKVTSKGADLTGGVGHHAMYSHGICTTALCEACVVTRDPALRQSAQMAIDFIVNAQHQAGGWRYEPGQAGDLSVTGWQIIALRTARAAKLRFPSKCIGKATAFLNAVQSDGGAQYGYDKPGDGPAMTAMGLLCRMYLGWTARQPALAKGVEIVGKLGPQPSNMYFNYYATQVLHHWGGEGWKTWNGVMREQLVKTQETEGDAAGNWPSADDLWGKAYGGRLYTTCLSLLTLEVYYREMSSELPPRIWRDSDLSQMQPASARSDGGIRWEQDHIFVKGSGTLTYRIPPQARRFTAEGVLNSTGRVRFLVSVDDGLRFLSEEIGEGGRVGIDVPLEAGNQTLELIAQSDASKGPGHVSWREPRWARWEAMEPDKPRSPFNVALVPPLSAESSEEIRWTPQSVRPSLQGPSRLRYQIPTGTKRFSALGATLGEGSVTFAVCVDGDEVYRSDEITRVNWTKIDVALVPGSQVLELRTDPTTKGAGQALWTEPRFSP